MPELSIYPFLRNAKVSTAGVQPIEGDASKADASAKMKKEHELAEACARGEQYAQHELFRLYNQKMMAVCRVYAANGDDAKDILMDGYVKILTNIKNFRQESSLETWMNRVMANTAVDHLRKKSKVNNRVDVAELEGKAADEDEDFFAQINISNDEILALVQKLPDGYRLVFCMYALEQNTHKDIAARLGISIGTSKSQYARARRVLQKWILERELILSN